MISKFEEKKRTQYFLAKAKRGAKLCFKEYQDQGYSFDNFFFRYYCDEFNSLSDGRLIFRIKIIFIIDSVEYDNGFSLALLEGTRPEDFVRYLKYFLDPIILPKRLN